MLTTEGLAYSYGQNEAIRFPDIQCASGEHWLLLGQSGSGKTTLLQLLSGLRSPSEGIVTIDDTVLDELPPEELDTFRGKNIGLIFQQAHFVRALSVKENLMLAQSLAGLMPDMNRIQAILEQLNVAHKLQAYTHQLSVGEQQRVAIARSIINQPAVILADEPTSALDDHNTHQVVELLKEQAAAVNAILIIVTHDNRLTSQFEQQIRL
jgi:ABC-type lipoprotein export system ATPase subunit